MNFCSPFQQICAILTANACTKIIAGFSCLNILLCPDGIWFLADKKSQSSLLQEKWRWQDQLNFRTTPFFCSPVCIVKHCCVTKTGIAVADGWLEREGRLGRGFLASTLISATIITDLLEVSLREGEKQDSFSIAMHYSVDLITVVFTGV